jgi:acyl-CoA synthetase (AMP-forming)/AMP-acid ligase II
MIDGAMQPFALTLDKFLGHAAKWHPRAEVVTAHENGRLGRIGYADLQRRSLRISAVLQGLGSKPGDRIATLAWNTQTHIEVLYAIIGMGAVCHTLNPRLTDVQCASMLAQSQARILIVSAPLWPLAQSILARLPGIEYALLVDGALQGGMSEVGSTQVRELEPMITAAPATGVIWGDFDENCPSGLCFTSGTTGAPKGVMYTHRSSFLHTMRILQVDAMAISGSDTVLAVVPMFHANAWGLPFAVPAVGAKLVLNGRHSDGATLEQLINAERVTVAVGIATVWLGLVEHLEATGALVPTLQRVIVGGAPLPNALMERMERRLGAIVQTSWGMTELSPSGTLSAPHDVSRSAAQSGRPAVGVDLLLTDAAGRALPEQRNVEGHLRVRGASVIARYFGDEQPATDSDGWLATGDLARIDAAGNLMITGRSKDLIKSGGEWINPAEIEAVVGAIPEVLLAAVIGRPDPKWGERPILLLQMRDQRSVSDDALLAPLKKRLPSWWVPDAIVRLKQMPLTSTGKIDRLRLRGEYGSD